MGSTVSRPRRTSMLELERFAICLLDICLLALSCQEKSLARGKKFLARPDMELEPRSAPLQNPLQSPQNPPEESQNPPRVALRGGQAAQQQAQIVAVGVLHRRVRIAGGDHGLSHPSSQSIETRGRPRGHAYRS